jgi:hypothetical protein
MVDDRLRVALQSWKLQGFQMVILEELSPTMQMTVGELQGLQRPQGVSQIVNSGWSSLMVHMTTGVDLVA